jgi:phosphatidylglycerol:prolipoprotein diacylglycerol transferase
MIRFLHDYLPQPILTNLGIWQIHWYGLIMAIAISSAILLSFYIGRKKGMNKNEIMDTAFWIIIGGLIGARIYEIFLEWPYYSSHPEKMIAVWEGGLAIHGALIGGFIAAIIVFRKKLADLLKYITIFLPGLALGQAIGRWGNYFNQELFGLPSDLPWSIPISFANRPTSFSQFQYFHPTFLYESLGNLIIAVALFLYVRRQKYQTSLAIAIYMLSYSLLRFLLEFIKIDKTPMISVLRWPQVASLIMAILAVVIIINNHEKKRD